MTQTNPSWASESKSGKTVVYESIQEMLDQKGSSGHDVEVRKKNTKPIKVIISKWIEGYGYDNWLTETTGIICSLRFFSEVVIIDGNAYHVSEMSGKSKASIRMDGPQCRRIEFPYACKDHRF